VDDYQVRSQDGGERVTGKGSFSQRRKWKIVGRPKRGGGGGKSIKKETEDGDKLPRGVKTSCTVWREK